MTLQTTVESTVRVVLVDDHTMFADSLAKVLETEESIHLVGIATTAADGITIIRDLDPDVAIVDFVLPDQEGSQLIAKIVSENPRTRVLVLTGFGDRRVLASAIEAGCSGFLTKEQAADDLVLAVRRLTDGAVHIPAALFDNLPARRTASLPQLRADDERGLTPRERDVLTCLCRGMTTSSIADELDVSVNTVRTHVQKMIGKLQAHSKLEAVTFALREGIVEMPD